MAIRIQDFCGLEACRVDKTDWLRAEADWLNAFQNNNWRDSRPASLL